MRMRKNSVFTIVMCVILAICVSLCACVTPTDITGGETNGKQDVSFTDDSGVAVSGKFESGAQLIVEKIEGAKKAEAIESIANEEYYKEADVYVYDISVVKDSVKVQPSGKAQITIPVLGLDTQKQYKVFHIKDGGAVETISPRIVNGKLVFETDSFSYFIVAEADTRVKVNVSINILPLAAYGTLKVNGILYVDAASYKTKHYEGDKITVEAIASDGHHFNYWLNQDDTVLSEEIEYEFTVGKKDIVFSAMFTEGHVVRYTDITEEEHTETCRFCDHTAIVAHTFINEEIKTEATCEHTGVKQLSCACGKTKTETIPLANHNYEDGVCTTCGAKQLYTRCNLNGTANPQGAYVKFGTHYSDKVESEEMCAKLLAQAGDPTTEEGIANWTVYDAESGMGNMYYCDQTVDGINCRGVYIKEYRDNNKCYLSPYYNQTEQQHNNYGEGYIYWFFERELLWAIENYKNGIATLRTEYVYESQPFHNIDEVVTYENSYIRSWLLSQLDEIFTQEQQAILIPNADCFNDKIYLPSEAELTSILDARKQVYGYYDYTFCMGVFYDYYNGVFGTPYWLRDGIVKTEDGNNYAKCTTTRYPYNEATSNNVIMTWVGVVPTVRIAL